MITIDQPNCFPDELLVAVSSSDDGTMLNREKGVHADKTIESRRVFCEKNSISYDDVVFHWIYYNDKATYNLVAEVDERSTVKHNDAVLADALITRAPGVGLFLPIADCIGLVLYDPVQRILAVVHMGRHSTLTDLIERVVARMVDDGANPHDIIAYMTPSAGKESYGMEYFDAQDDLEWQPYIQIRDKGIYLDLAGFNHNRLYQAGLSKENIHISPVDTVTSQDYFSHSAGDTSGRFAVLAMMR